MSAPIGPGDWLECINDAPHSWFGIRLTLGRLYCVERVWSVNERNDVTEDQVSLVGVPLPSRQSTGSWGIHRFRPIYRPKADFIESLKAPPITIRISEDA